MHAQISTLKNSSTLNQVAHPAECHAICALCLTEMTLTRARNLKIGKGHRVFKYSKKNAEASGPSRPEASNTNGTKRLGSSTPSAPRNGRNLLYFFSQTRCSMANDCPGRRGVEGPCWLCRRPFFFFRPPRRAGSTCWWAERRLWHPVRRGGRDRGMLAVGWCRSIISNSYIHDSNRQRRAPRRHDTGRQPCRQHCAFGGPP